jgi:hypothetical protein
MIGPILLAAHALGPPEMCALPSGWNQIEAIKPQFVLFGEMHGTRESPELVGSIACALSSQGQQVLVAVELDASTNPQLQALWDTPSAGFAERLVTELPYFAGRKDGVGSEAMLHLIERLHALARAGQSIDIVAFNGARDAAQAQRWRELPGQGPHEAEQAENIAAAASQKRYGHILVLAGNVHALKVPFDGSSVTFQPMAMHLAKSGSVISLIETYASGTMWNCLIGLSSSAQSSAANAPVDRDCGNHETNGRAIKPSTQVGLWRRPRRDLNAGYDGYYWFPVVHGSAPASGGATNQHTTAN